METKSKTRRENLKYRPGEYNKKRKQNKGTENKKERQKM
jgi:hypothetical protein